MLKIKLSILSGLLSRFTSWKRLYESRALLARVEWSRVKTIVMVRSLKVEISSRIKEVRMFWGPEYDSI